MNDFLSFDVNTNIKIVVHKNAFIDIIKLLPKTIDDIQLINNKYDVKFVQKNKNIIFIIDLKIKKGISFSQKLEQINLQLETNTKLLINKKPFNIILNVVETY